MTEGYGFSCRCFRRQAEDLDKSDGCRMIEQIARFVGGELLVVQGMRRATADDAAVAFEELESDGATHAFLNPFDERVERFAERTEPETAVHDFGVLQADPVREAIEVARCHQFLQFPVRRVQHY